MVHMNNRIKIEYYPHFVEDKKSLLLFPRIEFKCSGCENHMTYPLLKGYEYDRLESSAYDDMILKFRNWSFNNYGKDLWIEFEEYILSRMIFELENYNQVSKQETVPQKD